MRKDRTEPHLVTHFVPRAFNLFRNMSAIMILLQAVVDLISERRDGMSLCFHLAFSFL